MKKTILLFIFSTLIFLNSSSVSWADANILSFTLDGIVGEAEIATATRSVVFTVQPMDIHSVQPEIILSSGATLTSSPALKDGVPVTYVITAEDGTSTEWKITANVQYGASFLKDGVKTVFLYGWTNSDYSAEAQTMGNGIPAGVAMYDETVSVIGIWAAAKVHDLGAAADLSEPYEVLYLYIDGNTEETYASGTGGIYYFNYIKVTSTTPVFHNILRPEDSFSITIDDLGAEGGSISGVFSGTLSNPDNATDIYVITNGFYKVLRLVDNSVE